MCNLPHGMMLAASGMSSPYDLVISDNTYTGFVVSWTEGQQRFGNAANPMSSWRVSVSGTYFNSSIGSTTSTITGLAPGTVFSVSVWGFGSVVGLASASQPASTLATQAPSVPVSVTVSAVTSSGFTISWSASAQPGGLALSYAVSVGGAQVCAGTAITCVAVNLSPNVAYAYGVVAVNGAGNSSQVAGSATTLARAPTVPTAVGVIRLATHSFTITWQAPLDLGGLSVTYTVSLAGAALCSSIALLSCNATSLDPNVNYAYSVTASNTVGASSVVSQATTTLIGVADAPVAPGGGVCGIVNTRNVTVKWVTPAYVGGELSGFRVKVGNVLDNLTTIVTVSNEALFVKLEPGTAYIVLVEIFNSAGASASLSRSCTTLVAVPSEFVGPPRVLERTNFSIKVSLPKIVDPGGAVITYSAAARVAGSGAGLLTLAYVTSLTTNVTIAGLVENTDYDLVGRASNSAGEAPNALATRSARTRGRPSVVQGFSVASTEGTLTSGSTIVNVVAPPADDGGATNWYEVLAVTYPSAPLDAYVVLSTSNTSVVYVSGLQDGTVYYFRVRALTVFGEGAPSTLLEFVTPCAPQQLLLSQYRSAVGGTCQSSWFGATCVQTCISGFVAATATLVCGSNGRWTGGTPTCRSAPPAMSPSPGLFLHNLTVLLTTAAPGAVIRCTTDGSQPVATSPVCQLVTQASGFSTIKAVAYHVLGNSDVASGVYELHQAPAPPVLAISKVTGGAYTVSWSLPQDTGGIALTSIAVYEVRA